MAIDVRLRDIANPQHTYGNVDRGAVQAAAAPSGVGGEPEAAAGDGRRSGWRRAHSPGAPAAPSSWCGGRGWRRPSPWRGRRAPCPGRSHWPAASRAGGPWRSPPGLVVLDADRLGLPASRGDPTRPVVDVRGWGLNGAGVGRALRGRFGIAPEMSDRVGVVCLVTIGDTPASIDRLVAASAALAAERRRVDDGGSVICLRSAGEAIAPGPQALTPREAFFAPTRAVPLAEAVGAAAAEPVVPYPPGIPVLTPGEVVAVAKVDYLRHGLASGLHVRGPADPKRRTLRIVDGSGYGAAVTSAPSASAARPLT